MTDEYVIPDRRSMRQRFGALRLIGAIRQAFDLRKLIIAALGLALLQVGWSVLDWSVPIAADSTPALINAASSPGIVTGPAGWSWETFAALHSRLTEPFWVMATPLFAIVEPLGGWTRLLHALASVLWEIVVWSLCGGAIARIAIVQAAAMRQTTVTAAVRFALTNAGSLMMTPLCPLLGLAFCGAIGATFGLLYRLPAIGPALAGVVFIIPLALGLIMTLLAAGLAAGWPLFQAATAGGAEDALDALSRIFGYLNQRLGSYIGLVALAWMGGILGLAFVDILTAGVIRLSLWSLGLTAPSGVIQPFFNPAAESPAGFSAATHAFWLGLVRLFAHAWIYSFFWTAAAYLYLCLRYDVDGTPWSEIEPTGAPARPSQV